MGELDGWVIPPLRAGWVGFVVVCGLQGGRSFEWRPELMNCRARLLYLITRFRCLNPVHPNPRATSFPTRLLHDISLTSYCIDDSNPRPDCTPVSDYVRGSHGPWSPFHSLSHSCSRACAIGALTL